MMMSPRLRKVALIAHVTASVGWIGAVVAYLALVVAATTSPDAQILRAAWTAMELTGWYAIVPLSFVSLLTGLVMSLGTKWGLFRHYWVVFSLRRSHCLWQWSRRRLYRKKLRWVSLRGAPHPKETQDEREEVQAPLPLVV